MAPSMLTIEKRSVGFLFGMNTLMLGANLVWVAYITILLPTLVEKVVAVNRGLVVGLLGFFGTLLALLVSIVWGIISDHTTNKLGKRTPAILTGALIALPLIGLPSLIISPALRDFLIPLAIPIILISYFGMQFSTNMSNGAWWPLLVDVVPENQRGMASGIMGFMTLLGSAIGFLLVTSLNQDGRTAAALWLIAGVFTLSALVNVWAIRGKDKPAETTEHISVLRALTELFTVRTRIPVFFWLVLAMLLANMGLNSLQFFARYFFQTYFPAISPDAALRIMGGISLIVTMLSAVAAGILSDRIGRRTMILWGTVVCAVTTLLMGFTSSFTVFLVLTTLRSIALGPIVATAPALASDLSPKDEAGHYMAYNNLSTGLSTAFSALIGGLLLINNMNRSSFINMFIISAIMFAVGGIVFSVKVSQDELDAGYHTVAEQVGGST
jgi:MFS family permease